MLIPTLIMATIAIILLFIGYSKGHGEHIVGLKSGISLLLTILPLMCCAMIVAGMTQILLPREMLAHWVGTESGLRGIIIGSVAGGLTPGGPFVNLPIAAAMLQAGAGIGTMVAYLTGWSLWAIARLPMEIGLLGWKFTLVRFVSVIIFPPLAGLIAQALFGNIKSY